MNIAVPTASGSLRSITIPPEIILNITSYLFAPLRIPWIVGAGCCSERRLGPGAGLCGPLPEAHRSKSTSDVRALAATCRTLREMLSPLVKAFMGVKLRQGLRPLDAADDDGQFRPSNDVKILRRPEGFSSNHHVLPTDLLFDVADLPLRGDRHVKALNLSTITYTAEHPDARPSPMTTITTTTPPFRRHKTQLLHDAMLSVLDAYPALETLRIKLRYHPCGNCSYLPPALVDSVSRLENLRELVLEDVSLPSDMPVLRGVTRMQVRNCAVDCFDKLPSLRDFRMEHQPLFGTGVRFPPDVLRRLEHLTYCPPEYIDECRWLPDACLELSKQRQSGPQDQDPLPLRELIINGNIVGRELVDIVEGLATPNLDTFVCFGLMIWSYSQDMGREAEMESLVRDRFPNVRDQRFVFWNASEEYAKEAGPHQHD